METVITINVAEWLLHLVVIWLALSLADSTLALYKRYLEWRIKKQIDMKNKSNTYVGMLIYLLLSTITATIIFFITLIIK